MKNASSHIRQMRADADQLAQTKSQHARGPHPLQVAHALVLLRDHANMYRLRLRRLHLGERLRDGDLWLGHDGTLRALPSRWWCPRWLSRVGPGSVAHFRVET